MSRLTFALADVMSFHLWMMLLVLSVIRLWSPIGQANCLKVQKVVAAESHLILQSAAMAYISHNFSAAGQQRLQNELLKQKCSERATAECTIAVGQEQWGRPRFCADGPCAICVDV